MVWSMIALAALIAVFGVIGGLITFNPGGKPQQGQVPQFDAESAYRSDARSMPYPVRAPQVPADWQANSGRTESLAGEPVTVVGYVTPSGGFVELLQTSASVEDLRTVGTGPRPTAQPIPVGGNEWTIFRGDDDVREVWAIDLGDVRLGVSGLASQADFETMAQAAATAPPIQP